MGKTKGPLYPGRTLLEAGISQTTRSNEKLIATLPRLEMAVTHSYKRRKHFLAVTRTRVFSSDGSLQIFLSLWAGCCKINRKPELVEPPVSHSKLMAAPPMNRKPSRTPRFPFSIFSFPQISIQPPPSCAQACESNLHNPITSVIRDTTPSRLYPKERL